jgi:hypothetical protein
MVSTFQLKRSIRLSLTHTCTAWLDGAKKESGHQSRRRPLAVRNRLDCQQLPRLGADWATESLLAARQAYQVPETGIRPKSGQRLGGAYLEANLPVVRHRL